MRRFFVLDGRRYEGTGEYETMKNGTVLERFDIFDNISGKKVSSNLYTQKQVDKMLKASVKPNKKKK